MSLDEVLTVDDCARLGRVSARTIRREIAAGRIKVLRLRGRVRVTSAAWGEYLQQCRSVATVEPMRPDYSLPVDDLADLLRLTGTRRSGRRAPASGSQIVELAAHRATRSRKPSSAG